MGQHFGETLKNTEERVKIVRILPSVSFSRVKTGLAQADDSKLFKLESLLGAQPAFLEQCFYKGYKGRLESPFFTET